MVTVEGEEKTHLQRLVTYILDNLANDLPKKFNLLEFFLCAVVLIGGVSKLNTSGTVNLYVIGKSGVGKSSFVGYLQGHKMQLIESEELGDVIDYADEFSEGDRAKLAKIGHLASETKGAHTYEFPMKDSTWTAVDIAGVGDTQGVHIDLFNAMMVDMTSKEYPVHGIIYLLQSKDITDGRGEELKKIFKKLSTVTGASIIGVISFLRLTTEIHSVISGKGKIKLLWL